MTDQAKEVRLTSKLAGVGIDDWKLPIFKKHLDAAGYRYNDPVPLTDGTLLVQVHYEWVHELQPIIEAAQRECAEQRKAE
jgi:hypothetical protein